MPSLLGTKINELRRERGLTLEQLAQATDSSKSYMWEIENKDVGSRFRKGQADGEADAIGPSRNDCVLSCEIDFHFRNKIR